MYSHPLSHPRFGKKLALPLVAVILLLVLVGAADTTLPVGQLSAAAPPPPAASLTPIQHVVFIVKENRSFDNYFGTFPGAKGATTYRDATNKVRPLNHQPDPLSGGVGHRWQHARLAWDFGKMDKFALIPGAIQNGVDVADSQFYQSDIPNYWSYARSFALADNFFSSMMGPSFPNHLFTIAATGGDADDNPSISNPAFPLRWGCDSPTGTTVRQRHADGTVTYRFPCFHFRTLGTLLNKYNISWKYYAPPQDQPGYQWSAYNAIYGIRNTLQWKLHIVDPSNFEADVANGDLPAVSWLVPDSFSSEHAPHSACAGENWTIQKINAIMNNSSLWATTAVIVVWDDFGGFYDHVAPPKGPNPQIQYGFRVPALIVSPYTKPGYVDHTFYSFLSLLRFAERNFGLPALNANDRGANDMFRSFNFAQQPLPPQVLLPRSCPPSTKVIDLEDEDPE